MARGAGAIVLAAGLGGRFGGGKLLAQLDGRPLLQHVLDTVAEADLAPVVVVLGHQGSVLETAISWRGEERVRNPAPERGLASSLQVGLAAIEERSPETARILVLLGDQPRVRVGQLRVLLAQPPDAERPILVPRYVDGEPGNPVLLEGAAWPLAATLSGDRGMAQLFAARPELVRHIDLPGTNPDVDTPADLERLRG
jgi:molybdenum cofactor cytidylyltransferase